MAQFHRAVRALAVECLESKRLLAGDVSVATIEGNLFIDGDADGNQVQIRSLDAPGRFVVQGLPGPNGEITTINGNAEPLLVDGIDGRVMADMGAGDDALVIRGARFLNGVFLGTGPGDDAVILGLAPQGPDDPTAEQDSESLPSVVVEGPLVIHTGPGSDRVAEDRTLVNGTHSVQTGPGDDTVRIGLSDASEGEGRSVVVNGMLAVGLGLGDDTLGTDGVAARGAVLNGFLGDDQVGIRNSDFARSLVINGGVGEDDISLRQSRAGNALVRGGLGPDRVGSFGSAFGNLAMDLGQGDDSSVVVGTVVRGAALFAGGAGVDTIQGGMNWFNHVRVVGFEGHDSELQDEEEVRDASSAVLV